MSEKIKPCHCGYEGELMGMRHAGGFLSLTCPQCNRMVEGLHMEGLMAEWQKPAPTATREESL
ncbi:hypothetical protein PSGK_19055 [Pseudomonas solani]|uniref:hypothetical protein n=1 Tax=Pseudomonas solani TaxID=2731552 RepID=UPI0035BE11CD